MDLLVIGVLLWITVHLLPVSFHPLRTQIVHKIGLNPYKGIFTLSIVGAIVLMVLGWQSIDDMVIFYDLGHAGRGIAFLFIIVGFILLVSAKLKNNINRVVRHPELSGFSCWAFAHCLMNGDLHSLVLFGGLLIWAVTTIFLLNKRDGAFVKPEKQPFYRSVIVVVIGFGLVVGLALAHPFFTGVAITA